MATAWVVTAAAERVAMSPTGTGEVTFTLTNPGPVQDRAVFEVVPGEGADRTWFTVEEPQRLVPPGGSVSYLVKAAVPAGTSGGAYWVQGRAYSADAAPEESSALSGRVTFEVAAAKAPAPKPWWILAVAAMVLLVAGVAAWLVLREPDGPELVAVPGVVGDAAKDASQKLTSAGFVLDLDQGPHNTYPAGRVSAQTPEKDAMAAAGTRVTVTISTGKRETFDLLVLAEKAKWSTGAGDIPFNGSAADERGFALIRPAGTPLEDGSQSTLLETHPQWVANGSIEGDFTLSEPVIAGDHFRSTVGFIGGQAVGAGEFVVLAVDEDGTATELARIPDAGNDGQLRTVDVDLSKQVGLRTIRLRMEAGATSAQDWAAWVEPRVEGVGPARRVHNFQLPDIPLVKK
jgi:hypothetical protein